MKDHRSSSRGLALALVAVAVAGAPWAAARAQGVFVNELHYDNSGSDTGEFVEVAGAAGVDLEGYEIVLYNGTSSQRSTYGRIALSGLLLDQGGGLGTRAFFRAGIQNGAPDGLALVDPDGVVLQFLSYEGSFVAASGPAAGMTSTDIGVVETSSTPAGFSLQLSGTGCDAGDFSWNAPADDTPGQLNAGQAGAGCELVSEDVPPEVAETVPADGATDVDPASDLGVTFSEAVDVADGAFVLACESTGPLPAAASGGPQVFAIDPAGELPGADECTLTVRAAGVTDTDGEPDGLAGDVVVGFTTRVAFGQCGDAATPVGAVQGATDTSPLEGQAVVIEGVVVGDFEGGPGTSGTLRGFYVQDAGDGDGETSDGVFVFNGSNDSVELGDVVRVLATVEERFGQTQLGFPAAFASCGAGVLPAPVELTLPFPPADDAGVDYLERVEGMRVTFDRPLFVTELFQLDRFGQLTLAGGGRLPQPTAIAEPGAEAAAVLAANQLNRIILDDDLNVQNRFPVVFPTPDGLAPDNTVRGGDAVDAIDGVMTWTWGGNSASPNAWRVRPIFEPVFDAANPRPSAAPEVGGRLRIASFNVLNFFTTTDDGTERCGVPGAPQRCRGADDDEELERQLAKLRVALLGLDADVIGLVEVENNYVADPADPAAPPSAARVLADALNEDLEALLDEGARVYCEEYAAVEPGGFVGTDAIAVGMLYCVDTVGVAPDSAIAILDDAAVVAAGLPAAAQLPIFDGPSTNRASLAVTFEELETHERFGVVVNHFKSKGPGRVPDPAGDGTIDFDDLCERDGAGSDPNCDQGDGQGFWNDRRTVAAEALADWLEGDPTGGDPSGWMVVGDLNAYAREDPVTALFSDGYEDLIETFGEGDAPAYSFVFDGQWGYLDYALADEALEPAVAGVGEWHVNADEPDALDYDTSFNDPRLFAPDEFRTSDHDPLVVGLNPGAPRGDVDRDGRLNALDLLALRRALGSEAGDERYDRRADLDDSGRVDFRDFRLWLRYFVEFRREQRRSRHWSRWHPDDGGR